MRIPIKNIWVGDYVLPDNEELCDVLNIDKERDYTLRELILEAAAHNNCNIKELFFIGHVAYAVCDNENYTETCEFIDLFLETCKDKYGELMFAKLVNCTDPYDRYYHPKRVEQPLFTSQDAVKKMIKNIRPGMKLVQKKKETQSNVYTSYKKERSWKSVVIPDSPQVSNTSPLTGATNSQIENIRLEVQQLRKMITDEKEKNKRKYEEFAESVKELRNEVRRNRNEQQNLSVAVHEAVELMKSAVKEIHALSKRTTDFEFKVQKHFCMIGKPIPPDEEETPNTDNQDKVMSENKRLRDDVILEEESLTHHEPKHNFNLQDSIKLDGKKRLYKIRPGQSMRDGQGYK